MKKTGFGFAISWAVVLIVLVTGCSGSAGISLEDAAQKVIDEVIQPESLDHNLIAFAHAEPLQPGDVLQPYNFFGEDPTPGVIDITAESWFFWLDDEPTAQFRHPTRFVLVDRATGEISTSQSEWWPVLNGSGLWVGDDSYANPDNWIFSTVELEEGGSASRKPPSAKAILALLLSPFARQEDGPGLALVINASTPDERGSETFNTDARLMTDALEEAGFNTTYLGPEADSNPDRDGEPFGEAERSGDIPWRAYLRQHASTLQPGETLVVYVTGHGAYEEGSSVVGYKDNYIFDHNLKSELRKFNPGVHIVVIVDSCEAGGYTDALKDVADVTLTSSDHDSSSWGDNDFVLSFFNPLLLTDLNPFDEGSEYTSSLLEGWSNLNSDPGEIARIKSLAEAQGIGFWPLFLAEAYDDASEYDLGGRLGLTDPITSFGSEQTRPKIITTGATGDVKSCTPGGTPPEVVPARQDVGSLSAEWMEADGQHVLHFEAEFPGVETIDEGVWGGLEFLDPSQPTSTQDGDYIFGGLGNLQFGFFADIDQAQTRFNYADEDGAWQSADNPGYEVSVNGNIVNIDVPAYLVPPAGTYYFYTDDGSNCDSVGLGPDGPFGSLPPGGPFVFFEESDGLDSSLTAAFDDFIGEARFCHAETLVNDPGVDIQRVDFDYDPTVPGGFLVIDVVTGDPGPAALDNFSYFTVVSLSTGLTTQQAFYWQVHDGIVDTGEFDVNSGEQLESEATIDIFEDDRLGAPGTVFSFGFPMTLSDGIDGVQAFTTRLLQEGESTYCDSVFAFFPPDIFP